MTMTTEPNLADLLDRLASVAPVRPPAIDEAIGTVERRLGIRLSSEFREAYLRFDGTWDGTPPENGWFEMWPLARWYTVADYVRDWSEGHRFRHIDDAVVFADYMIESWHYAAHFAADGSLSTIYLIGLKPYPIAQSLAGFLAVALVDGIYPPEQA